MDLFDASVSSYRVTKSTDNKTIRHEEKHDQNSNKREILCQV